MQTALNRVSDRCVRQNPAAARSCFLPWSVRLLTAACVISSLCSARADDHPLSQPARDRLRTSLQDDVAMLTKQIEKAPDNVGLYSARGDARFFLGDFAEALVDYERMVELDPGQNESHWRRGIARFYAAKYDDAAKQFEIYHTFDDVDRENGIWRYFSQYRAYGPEKSKAGLLKYRKDDREPFPSVYRLFAGEVTPDEILKQIAEADIEDTERDKRLFYAHLYIGLNHALEDRREAAMKHLRESTASTWGPRAGYGPRYMWHVGRLHYDLLVSAGSQ